MLLDWPAGAIYPVKLEVAHSRTPLKLVGPGGVVVSAAGLTYGDGSTPMTAYNPGSGPKLVAAKLSVMSSAGESAPNPFSNALPNDGVALDGSAAQYRLRVFTSGGFSPDGVRSVYPTDYSQFFRIETVDADGVVRWLTQTGVPYQLPSGTITVVGLADLGPDLSPATMTPMLRITITRSTSCFRETKRRSPRSRPYRFPRPGMLFTCLTTPAGPGNNPTAGVTYSQPGPSRDGTGDPCGARQSDDSYVHRPWQRDRESRETRSFELVNRRIDIGELDGPSKAPGRSGTR